MKNKILKRIKKLLSMATHERSTPEEALIASKMARKLMDQHQVKISDLKEDSSFGTQTANGALKRRQKWQDWLCCSVADWNDCHSDQWWDNGQYNYRFKGFKADAIIAAYMFEYLRDTILKLCKEKGFSERGASYQYKLSITMTIKSRIRELITVRERESKTGDGKGLVVIKKALVEAEFGICNYENSKAREPTLDEIDAIIMGRNDGKKVGLNPHLDNKKTGEKS